jgi:hypothetical protein
MAALLDIVKKGVTDRSVTIRIIDSVAGTPETGVVFNTAGIDLWYRREGAAKTSITEATLAALTTAHADGGFLHIGDGEYRLDLPDAAFATGANHVDIGGTVTDMIVIGGRVRLVNYDPEDTVRLGLTALPNAAADAAGGLPISDAGGLDLDAQVTTKINAILADTGTDGVVIAAATMTSIADALLKRDWTAVTGEASRSALNALRLLRNKWAISAGTLTVEKEDDATDAWTAAVSTTAGNPISSVDPA